MNLRNSGYAIALIILLLLSGLALNGCSTSEVDRLTQQVSQLGREKQDMRRMHDQQMEKLKGELQEARVGSELLEELAMFMRGVKARIITNKGTIEVEFYPHAAPLHVFNFISKAESGFYDGTRFHRVIPGFMIQGGDPNSRSGEKESMGSGGPIHPIPHEFNELSHERGVLSMARVSDVRQGAGSQFFVMHADTPRLDNEYTVFGKVTSGMSVVDKIATTPTDRDNPRLSNHPVEAMIIERMEVYR